MGFLFAIGREAPCGPSGRFRVRMRAVGGGPGEGACWQCPPTQMAGDTYGTVGRLRKRLVTRSLLTFVNIPHFLPRQIVMDQNEGRNFDRWSGCRGCAIC